MHTWIHKYDPAEIIEALAPHVGENRKQRIEQTLARRLSGLTVVLENLYDPHNGAAALRSVEAMGLSSMHVVETTERFQFSSKVTLGCEKWLDIHRHRDFTGCAETLRAQGFRLQAAVLGRDARPLPELATDGKLAVVFGNEHAGLTESAIAACDGCFEIPMWGFTQSLNLSVSVALAVSDLVRRKRHPLGPSGGDLDEAERARLRAKWYALSLEARSAELIVERRFPR